MRSSLVGVLARKIKTDARYELNATKAKKQICHVPPSSATKAAVKEQLKRGIYQPKPVKRVWIEKPGSAEKRPMGIPTVTDRVVQAAVRMVIEPIFENRFAKHSYGFRPGCGCKDALRRVEEMLRAGNTHVVDVDIKGYFDTIPHDRLMALVREHVADGRVLGLIEGFLKQGVIEGQDWQEAKGEGTPQGGVISPLLANIYLDPLDWLMAGLGFEMVRYADDMVVLCRSQEMSRSYLYPFFSREITHHLNRGLACEDGSNNGKLWGKLTSEGFACLIAACFHSQDPACRDELL